MRRLYYLDRNMTNVPFFRAIYTSISNVLMLFGFNIVNGLETQAKVLMTSVIRPDMHYLKCT